MSSYDSDSDCDEVNGSGYELTQELIGSHDRNVNVTYVEDIDEKGAKTQPRTYCTTLLHGKIMGFSHENHIPNQHECLTEGVKPYVEFDLKLKNSEISQEEFKKLKCAIGANIRSILSTFYECDPADVMILCSSGSVDDEYQKISFHGIVDGPEYYLCGRVFKDHILPKLPKVLGKYDFDPQPYGSAGKRQNLRMPYCSKFGSKRKLRLVKFNENGEMVAYFKKIDYETFQKCLVQCVGGKKLSPLRPLPKVEREYPEDKRQLDEPALNKILAGIDVTRFRDYWKWTCMITSIRKAAADADFAINSALSWSLGDPQYASKKYSVGAKIEEIFNNANLMKKAWGVGHLLRELKSDSPNLYEEVAFDLGEKSSNYDVNDRSFYFIDFLEKLQRKGEKGHAWNSIGDLCMAFRRDVARVMVRTIGNSNYILKLDVKNPFHHERDLPDCLLYYWSAAGPGMPPKIKSVHFSKLVRNMTLNDVKLVNRLAFNPCGPDEQIENDPREFNMWPGFKAKLVEKVDMSKIQFILDHINIVWCRRDRQIYRYILSWLRHIFRTPQKKTRVVLVLRSSKQQIGKGSIIEDFLVPYVFGEQIGMVDAGTDSLIKRFNERLMNKIFISLDELQNLQSGANYHANFDIIKNRITQKTIEIEIKLGKQFTYPNMLNMIMQTNNEYSIKCEEGDARYAMFDCSNELQGNRAHFDELFRHIRQENADHFFTYVHGFEDAVDNILDIPMTDLKKDAIVSNLSSAKRFMHYVKEFITNEMADFTEEDHKYTWKQMIKENYPDILANKLFQAYTSYCDVEKERSVLSTTKFGREIKDILEKTYFKKGTIYRLETINSM
jgi:hypothetical protein